MKAPLWTERIARRLLTRAVRGLGDRGDEWGEAMLRELDEVPPGWAAVRWALGGAFAARRRPLRRLTVAIVATAAVAVGAPMLVGVRFVASPAMSPTLAVGDRVVIDRALFRLTGVGLGDLVLVELPGGHGPVEVTKRIIGLPGDTVSCVDGRVLRDGIAIDEPYLPAGTVTECVPATVPEGSVYLLGDARAVSADSRQYGPVPLDSVVARLVLRVTLPGV